VRGRPVTAGLLDEPEEWFAEIDTDSARLAPSHPARLTHPLSTAKSRQTVSLRCQGSVREEHRFSYILPSDDPTHETSAAWGVKEQLRRRLACITLAAARAERARFNQYVTWAATPETTRLRKTIDAWWPQIETFIQTRITNAKTEAVLGLT